MPSQLTPPSIVATGVEPEVMLASERLHPHGKDGPVAEPLDAKQIRVAPDSSMNDLIHRVRMGIHARASVPTHVRLNCANLQENVLKVESRRW